jgi:hypothetical protein
MVVVVGEIYELSNGECFFGYLLAEIEIKLEEENYVVWVLGCCLLRKSGREMFEDLSNESAINIQEQTDK